MHAVKPVTLTMPDGVERELRFTMGARRRIQDQLGTDLQSALNKYDSGAYPDILYALMHDEKGNPPDVTVSELAESLPIDANVEILAAIMSAMSQGAVTKNAAEAQIREVMAKNLSSLTSGGFESGPSASPGDTSESPTESSGGATSNAKSRHSSSGIRSRSASSTIAAA